MRINRFLSTSGVTSRRKADELVLQGRVSVNGVVVEEVGTRVDPLRDKIFVDGKQALRVHDFLYLVLNKPKDTITTISDERGRATVMDLVRTRERVYPVGRLDRNTTGVLLLTNDGDFAHHLMHPRFDVPKMYMVTCDRAVAREDLQHLRHGVPLADGLSTAAEVFAVPGTRGLGVAVTLHEGRNRQVRRMFEHLGYRVEKLDRVGYGPVTIEGLSRGQVRPLSREEIRALRKLAGITADD
jgi:23S rRNA pseudouridine2605 synthase